MIVRDEADILADETASYWLKQAILETSKRDALDVYNDVMLLFGVSKTRLTIALENTPAGEGAS